MKQLRGLVIRHRCDMPLCVNPEHLETGTQRQNVRDAMDRGRASVPPVLHGSAIGNSKLREADVLVIRQRLVAGELQRVIAADFGVTQTQISHIALRKQWGHV